MDRAAGTGRLTRETQATRLVDGLTDVSVLLFAAWTVIYHLGLLIRPPTYVLLLVWLAGAVAVAALYTVRRGWWAGQAWREATVPESETEPAPRWLLVVSVVAGVAAGTSAGLHSSGVPWWCAWVPGIVSVAASAGYVLQRRAPRDIWAETPRGGETRWGTPLALLTGAGFAVASLFIVNTDGDDAYFVSRSVATAATGEIPVKDVIFTPGTADAISGEPPVASIEVLAGAAARVLGVHAASFVWYLLLPAATFLAVWALWRLVRAWAPRRAALCFAVGAVYLLWSGTNRASLGSFHLLRMWQGKAVLVSVLIPLLLVYLTRWAERRTRGDLALLAAAGITAAGLTSSASFVVPLLVGAAAVALIAAGRIRTGLLACVALVYPIGSGLAVAAFYGDTTVPGAVHDAPGSYAWVLLEGTLGVIAGCALWLSPWTARRGVPALLATGVAAALTLLIVPGVLEAAADLSGAGQVLWRTMWIVPAPALIGLLASVRFPAGRWGTAVPAVALVVALVAGGTPVWSESNGSLVASRPSWKVPPDTVGTARNVVALAGPGGLVLMPTGVMRVVPLMTVRTQAVNANGHYLKLLPVPSRFIRDRQVLSDAVRRPSGHKPDAPEVAAALTRTKVDVACANPRDTRGLALLKAAGYRGERRVGNLRCLFAPRA
ncbi:hypothetical protein GCM10022254_08350 [Actinomadura meridiana]|uniref:Uncharacterized protein n=1 Tax=Actinomadura meridiana TaxID=559626 RepID=A0ABP8BU18_9ACTN